jgi:copper resistance protein B
MRHLTLSTFAVGMLVAFAGAATAQQQNGQMPMNMPGMDHSQMQGMDHSKMPMNMPGMDHSQMQGMRGNGQAGQGTRAPAPPKPIRSGAATQQRSN